MLTRDQLTSVLQACDLPFAHLVFDRPQQPPYVIVIECDTTNIVSDARVCRMMSGWQLELYYRDQADRVRFDEWLYGQDFSWQRIGTDTWIESEEIYMSRYQL